MASISEFIISVVELVEAQSDDIRHSFFKSANSFLINVIASVLAIVGFVFLLVGINSFFCSLIGKIQAYFLTALAAFILSFIFYKVASWKAK